MVSSIIRVFFSNTIVLFATAIIGFVVPRFISIEEYSIFQTFVLYSSYITVLQLGITNGMYIKYGGKDVNHIKNEELFSEYLLLTLVVSVFFVFGIVFSLLNRDAILLALVLTIIPYNINGTFKFFTQATGNFKVYSYINSSEPILNLLGISLLLIVIKQQNGISFVYVKVVSSLIILLWIVVNQIRVFKGVKPLRLFSHANINLYKIGFVFLLASFSTVLFKTVDRWFIKVFLQPQDFAYYSFAISLESIIFMFITAVTATFYPLLAKNNTIIEKQSKLKKYMLMFGTLSGSSYFVFEFLIKNYISKYTPSLHLLVLLFAAFPAIAVINAVYINLYKANKRTKSYLITTLVILIISIFLHSVAILLNKNVASIAIAETVTYYVWYFYSSTHFPELKTERQEILFLIYFLVALIVFTQFLTGFFSGIIFTLVMLCGWFIFFKNEIKEMSSILTKELMKISQRNDFG